MNAQIWDLSKGIILTLVVLLGLWLIQGGAKHIFLIVGDDLAIPGDEVGDLEIKQTRQIRLGWGGLLQVGGGLGVIAGTWIGLGRLDARFKKTF